MVAAVLYLIFNLVIVFKSLFGWHYVHDRCFALRVCGSRDPVNQTLQYIYHIMNCCARIPTTHLMVGLPCPLDMSAQTFLLLLQGLFLFTPHTFAAHDHHDRLIARLFAVRRATRCLFLPLALHRAELFSALATSRYQRHALLLVRLRLLAWAENIALRDESRCGVVCAG